MERVGISFRSTLTPDEVRELYINPFRAALASTAITYGKSTRRPLNRPSTCSCFK